ncbi:MAG: VOC family protein [Candidatus Obscuribacterales bacterium]
MDNLDEVVGALEARGVRFKTTLQETPWGKRVVVFDPDGRAVEIYQP